MFARAVAAATGTTVAAFSALTFLATPSYADVTASALSPVSGVTGTLVKITGSGLAGASSVTFPGASAVAPAAAPTDSEVDVVVPGAATSGPLVVTMSDSSTVQTPPFTVTPMAALTSSVASVVYPATSTLTATLTSGGAPVSGATATLETTPAGSDTTAAGPTATSDANGKVTFVVKPRYTARYVVDFAQTSAFGSATSNAVKVVQHPLVKASFPSPAPILTNLKVAGVVQPAQRGPVQLQRRDGGTWRTVGKTTLDSKSHFAFTVKLPKKATYYYRVHRPSDTSQAGNLSQTLKVLAVARTLKQGMSGPDVTALQKRLLALHYDVGAATGTFNYDTTHAVVAFQKVQGIARDGVVGPKAWKALGAPKAPRLRHPIAGAAAVEVDLAHQVLYYAVNGKITRILDSSTGGGYYYTGSDGTQQKAVTPRGHFSVKYKVDKWVKSKLGTLYRPAYFNYSGYAIHGEDEVPSYPASHGCVRITVPAMDRLYSKLSIGMSVWIY
jgi:lipoprotein-anchoring transpeptidase ErfK/SrfK